jgi:SOS-response transcriptional repressor LexA
MGNGTKVESKKAPAAATDGMWVSGKFVKGAFAMKVRGDSMVNPAGGLMTFPHGVIIIVDPAREAQPGSPVLVEFQDGRTAFRMLELDGLQKCLKPLNPIYSVQPMPEDARGVGVVIQVQVHTLTEAGERQRAARQAATEAAHAHN